MVKTASPVSILSGEGLFDSGVSWDLRRNPSEETRVEREQGGRAKGGIKPYRRSQAPEISCMELVLLNSVTLTSRTLSPPSSWVRELDYGSVVPLSESQTKNYEINAPVSVTQILFSTSEATSSSRHPEGL